MVNYEQEEQEYVGAEKLADAATEILRTADWFQADRVKGSVGAYPNARQIRFYEQQKLMEPPIERRRNAPVYRYTDLLILLAIKKLQETKRLPINVIKTLVADKTVEALEKLLAEEIQIFHDKSALDKYRQSIGHTDDSDVKVINDPDAQRDYLNSTSPKNETRELLESFLPKQKPPRESEGQLLFSASPPANPSQERWASKLEIQPRREVTEGVWKRYEFAPGLELHARQDFKTPDDVRPLLRIFERILKQIDAK